MNGPRFSQYQVNITNKISKVVYEVFVTATTIGDAKSLAVKKLGIELTRSDYKLEAWRLSR